VTTKYVTFEELPLEAQVQHLWTTMELHYPGECKHRDETVETAIRLLTENSRKNNTSSNGGIREVRRKEKERMASSHIKHEVGKLIFVTAVGAIITKLLEMAYDKQFDLDDEDDED
jgi:hypothetical protein